MSTQIRTIFSRLEDIRMDYMVDGMLVEIQPKEKTQDQLLKEYMDRLAKEKEGGKNAE